MGATLTALQTGKAAVQFVAAIEGYRYLLTDGSESAAVTAWAGTDWTQAIAGLSVVGQWEQAIDPWQPINGGGSVSLHIHPVNGVSNDAFGIDVHKTNAGDESPLATALDCNDTTVTVKYNTDFAASGTIHIGTENVGYTAKSGSTQFTTCTRGRYAPFKANTEASQRFGRPHRTLLYDYSTKLEPIVSEHPRRWIGRWVGVWMHKKDTSGSSPLLDIRAEAQLVFAGKITEIRDDPNTLGTIVTCEHVLDVISESVLMRDQYHADLQEGLYLPDDVTVNLTERYNSSTTDSILVADPLTVAAGFYKPADLISIFNEWMTDNDDAANTLVAGVFSIRSEGSASIVHFEYPAGFSVTFTSSPVDVFGILGLPTTAISGVYHLFIGFGQATGSATPVRVYGQDPIQFNNIQTAIVGAIAGIQNVALNVTVSKGDWVNQYTSLPELAKIRAATVSPSGSWGFILIDGQGPFLARKESEVKFEDIYAVPGITDFSEGFDPLSIGTTSIPVIKQIMVMGGYLQDILPRIFCSTGTSGYNHASHDSLGFGMGLAIPWELLGDPFLNSCDALDQATMADLMVRIDKPTKLAELLSSDLILRRASLVFKNGTVRFATWKTPTTTNADHTLTEANKATGSGVESAQRSAITLTSQWLRNSIKISYDRKVTGDDERYIRSFILEDRVSIDDTGGAKALTISARNYGRTFLGDSGTIEAIIPSFLSYMPYFSRPTRIIRRSIDMTLFEGVAPGDTCTLTDYYARDPQTGLRGLTTKPGIIIGHRCDWGGHEPGGRGDGARPMTGEVDVMIFDADRAGQYSPCAEVDDTAANAGYNVATKTLTCYANRHSEAAESADASYFPATAAVTVVEIDPATAAAPLTWNDTVASQTGNTITLTTGLAGWDTAKFYRVIPRVRSSCTTAQKLKSFQADDADGRIEDNDAANEYGSIPFNTLATSSMPITGVYAERHATLAYGDGKPLDCGYDRGLIRTINNLIDYKTALIAPMLRVTGITSVSGGGSLYQLMRIKPIHVGPAPASLRSRRYLRVSPFYRSSTGASVTLRITATNQFPQGDTSGNVDVYLPDPKAQASWSTSSTTWQTGAPAELDPTLIDGNGILWLIMEGTDAAQSYGWGDITLQEREL